MIACVACGKTVESVRSTRLTCSNACRQRAHRYRNTETLPVTVRGIDLRLGNYRAVLADVACDALICDPPYGARVHKGHDKAVVGVDGAKRRALPYAAFTEQDVREFVNFWAPRCRGWMAIMSCSSLSGAWLSAMRAVERYVFAPVPIVIQAMTVRLQGDGPSSSSVFLNVSRPTGKQWLGGWTSKGNYVVGRGPPGHIGGKPVELMTQIVADYSRPGDVVADPCAGFATTAVAARAIGRSFVGAEIDSATYAAAIARLAL